MRAGRRRQPQTDMSAENAVAVLDRLEGAGLDELDDDDRHDLALLESLRR